MVDRVKMVGFSKAVPLSRSRYADHGALRGSASFGPAHENEWSKVSWLLDQINSYTSPGMAVVCLSVCVWPSGPFERERVEALRVELQTHNCINACCKSSTRPCGLSRTTIRSTISTRDTRTAQPPIRQRSQSASRYNLTHARNTPLMNGPKKVRARHIGMEDSHNRAHNLWRPQPHYASPDRSNAACWMRGGTWCRLRNPRC